MQCNFRLNAEGVWRCTRCGWTFPRKLDKPPHRNCPAGNNRSRGLGDSVAKLTGKLGIKPCGGCKKRQERLNRWFPYK